MSRKSLFWALVSRSRHLRPLGSVGRGVAKSFARESMRGQPTSSLLNTADGLGATQAGKFWESNMNSNQCPLDTIPSLSWNFFVASPALWVAQSWARTAISAWTEGKDAGATTLRKRRYRWSWRHRSRLRSFCQIQVTKQEKEGLRIRGAPVLLILGVLGAWGWSS